MDQSELSKKYLEMLDVVEIIKISSMMIGYQYEITENKRYNKISILKDQTSKLSIVLYKSTSLLKVQTIINGHIEKKIMSSDLKQEERVSFLNKVLEEL